MAPQPTPPPAATTRMGTPHVVIVEQPAGKALRFRYQCEGRSAGSIPGVNSVPENKTYPTIKICNYVGQCTIVVSCVTKDVPYRPHPHNLVGRDHCDQGVYTVFATITEDSTEYPFRNLGIQCVKRRDIVAALQTRARLRVDPFRTSFDHQNNTQSIDLNAVRLAFQVFIPDKKGEMRVPLTPVVSDVIYDKKAMSELLIMRASHCSGAARGGTQVILLCEKVTREDTVIVFYEEANGCVVWQSQVSTFLVHKQYAIVFDTPPYRDPHTIQHVNVRFHLMRTSDGEQSNSLPFEYIPDQPEMKRQRKTPLTAIINSFESDRNYKQERQIKLEPKDRTPPHVVSSPPYVYNTPTQQPYDRMNWLPETSMGAGTSGAGGAGGAGLAFHELPWAGGLAAASPLSPHQSMSPGRQTHSPMSVASSPNPVMLGHTSPLMMDHIDQTPLVQQQNYAQQVAGVGLGVGVGVGAGVGDVAGASEPSLSHLLYESGAPPQLNSSDLSSLYSILEPARSDLDNFGHSFQP